MTQTKRTVSKKASIVEALVKKKRAPMCLTMAMIKDRIMIAAKATRHSPMTTSTDKRGKAHSSETNTTVYCVGYCWLTQVPEEREKPF